MFFGVRVPWYIMKRYILEDKYLSDAYIYQ